MNWSWWNENGALQFQSPPGWLLSWVGAGGSACCQDTDRVQSRGPAALLGNTFDPQVTPNWPLTWEVAPNQGSHAGKADAAYLLLDTQSTQCHPWSVSYKATSANIPNRILLNHCYMCCHQYDMWHLENVFEVIPCSIKDFRMAKHWDQFIEKGKKVPCKILKGQIFQFVKE